MFVWEPKALIGLAALAAGWGAGILVYAASPRRAQNRALAVLLVLEGTGVGIARGVNFFLEDYEVRRALSTVVAVNMVFVPVVYWLFLSRLPSRPARWMRPWPLVAALAVLATLEALYLLLHPAELETTYFRAANIWTGFGLVGLAVAATVIWSSPKGSAARRQGIAYAVAFGVRDVAWFSYFWLIVPAFAGRDDTSKAWEMFFAFFAPSITITFVALLAYGILRTQLFDIDLRIKAGLGRSLAVGLVAAAFFVVSEVAEALLPLNGIVAGVAAAALVTLAFFPLQRACLRLLDRAMPATRDTPEYRAARKEEVWTAALEEMSRDGRLSQKDQRQLADLRTRLGLPARVPAAT